ncbi:hypothetical protein C8J56DRAFT_460138 [Mycena floridula]|nr:hypothetical protein C8J56DRAFT_460138 [Mycena floridula]
MPRSHRINIFIFSCFSFCLCLSKIVDKICTRPRAEQAARKRATFWLCHSVRYPIGLYFRLLCLQLQNTLQKDTRRTLNW